MTIMTKKKKNIILIRNKHVLFQQYTKISEKNILNH